MVRISRAHHNTWRVVAEILGLVLMEILEKEKYGSLFCVPTYKLVLLPGAKGRAAFQVLPLVTPQLNGTLIP